MRMPHRPLLTAVSMSCLLAGAFDVAVAQQSTSPDPSRVPRGVLAPSPAAGVVTGRVTEKGLGAPLAAAQVSVDGTKLGAITDDAGRFTITGVPAGDKHVTARRLGYEAGARSVNVTDGGTATIDFELTRIPTTLSAVVTTVTGAQEKVKIGNAIAQMSPDTVLKAAPVTNMND